MRTVVIVALSLAAMGGAAPAQTGLPAADRGSPPLAEANAKSSVSPGAATTAKRARNGRARRVAAADSQEAARKSSTVEEALTSCLAMWEPATHMTKAQWERACRRVAERLRTTTVR